MTVKKYLDPISPGDVLLEEFLIPLNISQATLAKMIQVPPNRISQVVHGKREITTETALKLAKYFGNSTQFWLNLELQYKLEKIKPFAKKITQNIPQYDELAA